MKKLLLFSLVLFISTQLFSQEGQLWKWSNSQPQGQTLRWVKVWDNNNWYAVGYNGTFMKTTDAGATWYFHHSAGVPTSSGDYGGDLYAAYFKNKDTGFTVGSGGVMTTVNGGQTFQPIAVPLGTSSTNYNVYMLNNMVGYISGTSSTRIAKTTDGGHSWTLNTVITSATYYDVWSPDENIIVAATTSGNVRRSTDGGLTWTAILTGASSTLYDLEFINSTTGYVCGSSSAFRMTTDAGLTWTDIGTTLPTGKTFYEIDVIGGAIYLTGDSFSIYKSTDNGATWTTVDFLGSTQRWTGAYYSSYFLADRFVTVGLYGNINLKIGSGTPSVLTMYAKAGTLYDMYVESATGKVIAVGAYGNSTSYDQFMYSTNGGTTWLISGLTKGNTGAAVADDETNGEMLTATSLATFRGIDMVNLNNGFAVGSLGAVYKTSNGGVTWDSVVTPVASTVTLYDVDFVDANTGWIVGTTGIIQKTTDGGATWVPQTSGITGTVYTISMADALKGWLAGASGGLYYTSDGGTTWTAQTSGFGTSIIYGMKAVNGNVAYIAGASGKFAKTTDGGTTWTLLPLPAPMTTTTLYSIDFANESYGAVCGSTGRIASTTDGGTTWIVENTNGSTLYTIKIAVTGGNTRAAFTAGSSAFIFKNAMFSVPVELTSLAASVSGTKVSLNWATASETNNKGFAVERKSNRIFEQVAFVDGKGTTTNSQNYSYSETVSAGIYTYRLKQVDFDGTISYSKEVEANVLTPAEFSLSQNYPNPFNPSTIIRYQVPVDGFVKLSVYNLLGEKAADIVSEYVKAGSYEVNFNAANLTSGVYIYKLESGSFVKTMKMSIVK